MLTQSQIEMAGTIGRITGALATVHNENALSLANVNFDFTLVKLDVPAEFNGIGSTISRGRKMEAENGNLHRTARKLGALFEKHIPSVQALYRAYGARVSEISALPSVNPQGSERDGVFASQIGADSASIWAAVTSGEGAIAVHLLACMLARIFTGPEATSVWVELVEKQKERLIEENNRTLYIQQHDGAGRAALQEISRTELANWDASARAWLQSADQAKVRQHKQMMLILESSNIPVNNETDIHRSVSKAWIAALQAMDNLIKGMPQQVQDGAALLAISSWHMYPDMVVLGGTAVDVGQRDPLFAGTAVLTLGLQSIGGTQQSVSWSLPLARLQYYGHPIRTSGTAGQDNSRLTPQQWGFVILGCVFGCWKDFASTNEVGLEWLERTIGFLKKSGEANAKRETDLNKSDGDETRERPPVRPPVFFWLNYLQVVTRDLEDCNDIDKKLAGQLLALGRRRSKFIYSPGSPPPPLFGLADLSILLPLLASNKTRLDVLLNLSSQLELDEDDYILRFKTLRGINTHEYISLKPRKAANVPDCEETSCTRENCPFGSIHWLPISQKELLDTERSSHWPNEEVVERHAIITRHGAICLPVLIVGGVGGVTERVVFGTGEDFWKASDDLKRILTEKKRGTVSHKPSFFCGDRDEFSVFRLSPEAPPMPASGNYVTPSLLTGVLTPDLFDTKKLMEFFIRPWGNAVRNMILSLQASVAVSNIYKLLPDATISTLILSQSLPSAKWIPTNHSRGRSPTNAPEGEFSLSRPQTFACIAMLDSGTCDLDPATLGEVFALSSGNSIYVSGALLCDPYEKPREVEVRRVIGNIGRAGVSLLIAPPNQKIRDADLQSWQEINHLPFDGTAEDCFRQTSVHLSFTGYEMPLINNSEQRHIIDRPVNLIETLVSVYDRGKWIADLDVLGALSSKLPARLYRIECDPQSLSIEGRKAC